MGLRYANPQPPSVVASVASDSDTPVPTTPFFVDRRLTGHGEQHGGLAVTLTNHGAKPVRCIYLDILPWFMRVYMHTLSVDVISIAPAASTTRRSRVNDLAALATNLHYQPAIDRHRPSVIEMTLDIPARSTVTLHVDFDKALLRYTEYPPDANRGFDLGYGN